MAAIVSAQPARVDLEAAFDAIAAAGGSNAAMSFFRRVSGRLGQLQAFPLAGHPEPKHGGGIRIAMVAPYLIIRRATDDTVTVQRVLHGQRDIAPEAMG